MKFLINFNVFSMNSNFLSKGLYIIDINRLNIEFQLKLLK